MTTVAASHSDTIDLASVVRVVRRGWRVILAFVVFGAAVAAAVIRYAPPKFTGKATMVVGVGKDRGSLLSQLAGIGDAGGVLGGGIKAALETETQLIRSRGVVGQLVDSLRLQTRVVYPRRIPSLAVVKRVEVAESFRRGRFRFVRDPGGGFAITGKNFNATMTGNEATLPMGRILFADSATLPPEFVLDVRDRQDAVDRVLSHLSIEKSGGELMHVIYKGDDSLSAARGANVLVEAYFKRRRTTDRGANQERVVFLSAKLDSLSNELKAAMSDLRKQQEASGVFDPEVMGQVELEQAASLRMSLTELAVEEASLRQAIDRVQRGDGNVRELLAFPSFLKAPGMNTLHSALTQADAALSEQRMSRAAGDISVVVLDSSRRHLEAQLMPMATSYVTSLSRQRRDVQAALDTIQAAVAALPAAAERTERLKGEVLSLGKNYSLLQTELINARLAALTEGGNVKLLDAAVPDKRVSFPKPLHTMAAGVGGGLLFGFVAAVMIGMLGRWMQDPDDVERSTGVPTLTFDPRAPLLVSTRATRTVLVAPLDPLALAGPVVDRLAKTAISRSMTATVLDMSQGANGADINAMISRLEVDHELVIVHLPGLVSDEAAAALRDNRPVLLVTPERRVDRSQLAGAVQLLRRLDVPCAGIVMSGGNGRHSRLAPRAPVVQPAG